MPNLVAPPVGAARENIVSLRELQAALAAARAGQFAAGSLATSATPSLGARSRRVRSAPSERPGSPPFDSPAVVAALESIVLLGAHGGSGVKCLGQVLGGVAVARDWPLTLPEHCPSDALPPPAQPVVLVCRSDAAGLTSAQRLVREHRDAEWSSRVRLVGVAVLADAPGRLPAVLSRAQRLVAAAVPKLWSVPWMPEWRLGPPDPDRRPEWAERLVVELAAAIAQ